MSLELSSMVEVIEVMENYVERVRPPEKVRGKLDISYDIENQSVILVELRPDFQNPGEKIRIGYAKATFVKRNSSWKVYWVRSNLKWTLYRPKPEVKNLKEFVKLVDDDVNYCFNG